MPDTVERPTRVTDQPSVSSGRSAGREPAGFGRVFACVLTYNRKDILVICVRALLAQSRPPDNILIFDNGSTDGTREFLEQQGLLLANLSLVRSEENLGPAGGFSGLFQHAYKAGADWIWVMDDDVVPEPDALEELIRAYAVNFKRPEDIGFLASRLQTPDGQPNNVPDVDNSQDASTPPRWAELLHYGMVRIKFSTFCSDLIPRSTIDAFGFPCADFYYGAEDVDYTLRVSKHRAGYIVGRSLATHLRAVAGTFHPASESNISRIPYYYYFYRNQIYLRRSLMSRRALVEYLIGVSRDIIRVLYKSPHRRAMLTVMLRGFAAGLVFQPRRLGSETHPTQPANQSAK